jgi:hypothetical protein
VKTHDHQQKRKEYCPSSLLIPARDFFVTPRAECVFGEEQQTNPTI